MPFKVDNTTAMFWGVVHYRGAAQDCRGRENFQVDFEDGEQVSYTERSITKFLVKEGKEWPSDRFRPIPAARHRPIVFTTLRPSAVMLHVCCVCCYLLAIWVLGVLLETIGRCGVWLGVKIFNKSF